MTLKDLDVLANSSDASYANLSPNDPRRMGMRCLELTN